MSTQSTPSGYATVPLLFIDAFQIELWGEIAFLFNTNYIFSGVHIRCGRGHLIIYSGSRIVFSDNHFHGDALYVESCVFAMGSNNAATATMIFANNVIESGVVNCKSQLTVINSAYELEIYTCACI